MLNNFKVEAEQHKTEMIDLWKIINKPYDKYLMPTKKLFRSFKVSRDALKVLDDKR